MRAQIEQVGQDVKRQIDPGHRAMIIAVAVMALLASQILPWAVGHTGFDLLTKPMPAAEKISIIVKIFDGMALVIGVLASALAIITRRWALAWVCAFGGALTLVFGVLSIWTRQTVLNAPHGVQAGLIVAVLSVLVLVVQWFKIVTARPLGEE
ncbi:hypothetical protein D5S17_12485 [Pseudonocardiaceae bacterium YIM PH 21723]|nr:hypothetical protein D5S17_12485 [Pseudonocardiaceae bacterium YIM PH 21723]